jgi:hypothetical protein
MSGANGVGLRVRLRTNAPWIGVLVLTCGFQFFRGAPMDGMVFAVAGLLLIADLFGVLSFVRIPSPRPRRVVSIGAGVVLALLLTFLPRYSVADGIVLVAIGLTLVPFVWADPPGRMHEEQDADEEGTKDAARRAITRTAILWSAVGVLLCIWELAAFFLAMPSPDAEYKHPPLSDLIDPIMDNPLGRFACVALWLLAGVGLLRRGRQPR